MGAILSTLAELGGWSWLIFAAVLLLLDLALTGLFFIWFAVAAAVVGVATLATGMSWQWQMVFFCRTLGRRRDRDAKSDAKAV